MGTNIEFNLFSVGKMALEIGEVVSFIAILKVSVRNVANDAALPYNQ